MTDSPAPLSRRGFLAGLGATAAIAAAPAFAGETLTAAAETVVRSHTAAPALDLNEIQGNILSGFNKDFAAFVAVQFPTAKAGRAWLAALAPQIASATEVSAFNTAFRAVTARAGSAQPALAATWLNIAFTYPGLKALGVTATDLAHFPSEFRSGMVARACRAR